VFEHWIEKNVDWCLSRQLWWGHRIPVWYRGDEVKCQVDSPGDDWEQDPDVLDTWFSSWLWPFETMDAATEQKFYPTDDLVTGPDIIFLWVARMIMAGLEFRGQKPFRHVFFTSLIRDIHGRKMSRRLGNSPNPLDLIDKYGADGLRFGLMRIAPQGQDIRFDEKQIEEGRNFANKLWNAVRFRQMQGPSVPDPQLDGLQLSPYSIDILANLDALIRNIEKAYREYRFGEIAQLLYDFFWSQYCDWYVEAAKTEVFSESESSRNSALTVMDYVISRLLRLLHPFMPHITEELWDTLGYTAENHGTRGHYILYAAWPTASATEGLAPELVETAGTETSAVYRSVHAVRNLRAEYRIPSNRKVHFILKTDADWISRELETFARLTNASQVEMDGAYAAKPGVPRILTELGEIYMPLEGLIDVDVELSRLEKDIAKTENELHKVVKKLANEKFTANAPAEVVANHRHREADWKSKLEQLRKMKSALEV